MKTMNFILIILLCTSTACNKENDELKPYVTNFLSFEPMVKDKIYTLAQIDKNFSDSATQMTDFLIIELSYSSCIYCVDEGIINTFPEYCRKNRKALLFVADRYFRDYHGGLKYVFQALFREFYPDAYSQLLTGANIKLDLANEMVNRDREYQLSFESLFNLYLEIEFK